MRLRTSLQLPRRGIALELALAVFGALTIGINIGGTDAVRPPLSLAVAGTALLAVLLFLFRRTAPLLPFVAGAVLTLLEPAVSSAALVTSYAVGRYERRWPVRAGAAVLGFVAVAQPWAVDSVNQAAGAVVGAAFVVLLPGAVGAWVLTRADLMTALEERAQRAEAERELLARDAVISERTRIAREMHDAVGHRVSLMVLQAGAIEMAAGDRATVEQLAAQVQTAGRQALDELRQAVGVLRAGEDDGAPLAPQPGLDDLERLVKEWRTAGMTVELHGPPPDASPVDAVVSRAAYRIVQEALTNAGKHAPGARVTVEVERPRDAVVVRVVNGPGGAPVEEMTGGYGLVGLRERVRTLDGRFRAEARLDGGFLVEAVLPA
ncbi:sensor histidine kinase [Blastococcus deserti]|uniref:histidine kinase n=1 Tax=Blastococcus deserti TaxID=2259033 RepID=A0ABW4X7V6_9ACTN